MAFYPKNYREGGGGGGERREETMNVIKLGTNVSSITQIDR